LNIVSGFSKLSKEERVKAMLGDLSLSDKSTTEMIQSFWHPDTHAQKIFDEFSENTLTNYYLPYGVVPNVLINSQSYWVPMAIEESSVVAASSKSAKFWHSVGGLEAVVHSTTKVGQVHFSYNGSFEKLKTFFLSIKKELIDGLSSITANMNKRGGGLLEMECLDKTDLEENYYQIFCKFETCDAMGANFINSCLEKISSDFKELVQGSEVFSDSEEIDIIMSILSNFTPECLVEVKAKCSIKDLEKISMDLTGREFAEKIQKAVRISHIDPYRAATHNKGIFNGIDAVVLATGNDFRAIEACGHAYAARDGQYRGLTRVDIEGDQFCFSLKLPLALGTVGGLTSLHPCAKLSLDILQRPNSSKLMEIACSIGLLQNFAALTSLVTFGIQKGHMKMHLVNILNSLQASDEEKEIIKKKFQDKIVSVEGVRESLRKIREYH
jgi:hydroxymethylglutaryl-CoA reductase